MIGFIKMIGVLEHLKNLFFFHFEILVSYFLWTKRLISKF
jgi:hypothetical protein